MTESLNSVMKLALSILQEAGNRGIHLKALGGVAINLLCAQAQAKYPMLARLPGDIDLIGLSEDASRIGEVVGKVGFTPDKEFNFLNARERMRFARDAIRLDILLDIFRMCHTWSLRERIQTPDSLTIPLGDLLLTKLQIVELSEKDLKDIAALVVTLDDIRPEQRNAVTSYVAEKTARDWGLYHTCCLSLGTLGAWISSDQFLSSRSVVERGIATVTGSMYQANKSGWWYIRSLVGPKIRWYSRPEEVLEA